ncbi:MAG: enoyl-CoA hydratase/isomerase family protein [Planctomycetota bacterium]
MMTIDHELLSEDVREIRLGGEATLDPDSLDRLERILGELEKDANCRVLVLSGSDPFCRGMDLGRVLSMADGELQPCLEQFARVLARLHHLKAVVIAVVDGEVAAGGVGLVAAADHVIATERATFTLPEAVLGLVPAMVLPMLLGRMASQKARWLAASALPCSAHRAREIGLVDVVTTHDELERELKRLERQLVRVDPAASRRIARLLSGLTSRSLEEALSAGASLTAERLRDPSVRRSIAAFLEGRSPWTIESEAV